MVTDEEKKCLELTADLWIAMNALPILHPADLPELSIKIHDIQNMILARSGYAEMKEIIKR